MVTPLVRNLRYIIGISLSSRILVIILQLISNLAIPDHNADAYRNKYHQALTKLGNNTSSPKVDLPSTYVLSYEIISGLTRWDSQYILEISKDGYVSEPHLAFLPLYPMTISIVKQLLFGNSKIDLNFMLSRKFTMGESEVSTEELKDYVRSAFVGFALNNFVFFPLAAICLFYLTKLVKLDDEKYSRKVVCWFCFNPASIFFSACYCESIVAALNFLAIFIIEHNAGRYLAKHEDTVKSSSDSSVEKMKKRPFVPLAHLNRLLYISLPSLAVLAMATATKSISLFTIGFLAYQLLLKYAPLVQADRSGLSLFMYVAVVLEVLQDLLVLVMSVVIAASGYISFQLYSYIQFCTQHSTDHAIKSAARGILNLKPSWCNNLIPHPYGYVQAKYWNVGFLRYYELKQLPNVLLASPIAYLVLNGSLTKCKAMVKQRTSANLRKQLVYYLHGVIFTIICSVCINVQVITRLIASTCPVFYWICADLSEKSRFKSRILKIFFASFFVVGTMLHANFYPWT